MRKTDNRVQKIDEAKKVIARLEERKGMKLSGPRGRLFEAGHSIDCQVYMTHMENAMGQTAGLAIEAGHDELASEATDIVVELQEDNLESK